MDAKDKLMRKLSPRDRLALAELIEQVLKPTSHGNLDVKKMAGGEGYYRAKKTKFRIIFHFDSKNEVIIDAVRTRNEKTYKDF